MKNRYKQIIKIIMKGIYTQPNLKWLNLIEDNEFEPFIIQKMLAMNDYIRSQVRWLDKYVFPLQDNPKMYLSLAWTVIPKFRKVPFTPYIKKKSEKDEYDFILKKVRKQFKLSDNDFRKVRDRIVRAIEKDKVNWFSYYGVPKRYWKDHYLNFEQIKEFGEPPKPKIQGLDRWGIT